MKADLEEIIDLLNGPQACMLRHMVDENNVYEVVEQLLQDHADLLSRLEDIQSTIGDLLA